MTAVRALDVLMFLPDMHGDGPPAFIVVAEGSIAFWAQLGWIVLAKERDVRYADIEDVRREDEQRWG